MKWFWRRKITKPEPATATQKDELKDKTLDKGDHIPPKLTNANNPPVFHNIEMRAILDKVKDTAVKHRGISRQTVDKESRVLLEELERRLRDGP